MQKQRLAAALVAVAALVAAGVVRAAEENPDQQRGFYDYLRRAAQEGSPVPVIGQAADESGRDTPYIGWTSGGMEAGSGSSMPQSDANSARGQDLTPEALARASVRAIAASAIMR